MSLGRRKLKWGKTAEGENIKMFISDKLHSSEELFDAGAAGKDTTALFVALYTFV